MSLEALVQKSHVTLTLLRDGAERELRVPLSAVTSDGTQHIVMWCGLILQQAYRAVLERGFCPSEGGVYISYYLFGSPAHKYKLVPKHWLTELNGQPVSDLAAFLEMVASIPHGAAVRVKTVDLNGKVGAYTLKTDYNYWRGYQVRHSDGHCQLQPLLQEPLAVQAPATETQTREQASTRSAATVPL